MFETILSNKFPQLIIIWEEEEEKKNKDLEREEKRCFLCVKCNRHKRHLQIHTYT